MRIINNQITITTIWNLGYPVKAVLLEVSREPGAAWALIGGILFMLGQ